VFLDVGLAPSLAAPAAVQVAGDDAGAAQRTANALAQGVSVRPHLPVTLREQKLARRRRDSVLEVRDQGGRDRHGLLSRAFRGLTAVRAAHHEQPAHEVDVALAEAEEFALPKAGVHSYRGDRAVAQG
jgi:hypothetical protein